MICDHKYIFDSNREFCIKFKFHAFGKDLVLFCLVDVYKNHKNQLILHNRGRIIFNFKYRQRGGLEALGLSNKKIYYQNESQNFDGQF